jgi:purine nucleosidase/adenosylhomocysteine nucleosidase
MSRQLYVFATELEAEIPREKTSREIFITGMGPYSAAVNLTRHLTKNRYDSVVNIGFAGSLKEGAQVGEFYEIHTLGKAHHPKLSAKPQRRFPEASLFTSDFPIHDMELRRQLSKEYDLVDMEGWAIATTCAYMKIPCAFIKVVSDFCSTTTSEEIRDRGKELSLLIYSTCF